jgi:DNA-binding response OmpR family regulator
MDGLETLRHMKERDAGCRVIMVTAYASVELAVDAMKLGATDFLRKPMTPEMLRNAVTAALAKPAALATPPSSKEEEAAPAIPNISRVTFNGFRFWADPDPRTPGFDPRSRRLIVADPDGEQHHVQVVFDGTSVALLERRAERALPPDSNFWQALAEHCLNAFLWNEAAVPPSGRLTVEPSAIDLDAVRMAKRW